MTTLTTSINEIPKKTHISPFSRNIIDISELDIIIKRGYNHGVCGGYNLGNTCFMNSSIACLSNCSELTTYFLTQKYKEDINKNNKEGLYGKLANAWYNLLVEYWLTNTKAGNPGNVKSVISKKVEKFSGYNQQDSNEFMIEFLSILSEDLNKTDKKKYVELKEKEDEEDDLKCASRFWKLHLERNDSIITDLFSGLLKSEVICNSCGFDNVTFDPFNTLTLAIPSNTFISKKSNYEDIILYYIPKYCIKNNIKLRIRVKRECPLKEVKEEIKKLKNFNFNIQNLKFIQVSDGKFIRFIDENEFQKENKFIFIFDDESKEGENNKIIPFYMNINNIKNSAFPRLLFIKENMNFGELKRKINYFARNYYKNPFNNREKEEICELDKEIKKYKETKKGDNYDENKLFELYDKEYNDILNQQKEEKNENKEIENFLNDFPYNIIIKKSYEGKEQILLFDGKNNLENLEQFQISKDEDSITNLLDNIESKGYALFLVFKASSIYSNHNIKLDSCENVDSPDFGKREKLTLYNLLEYFCSDEYLDKGNEWYCKKCKKKVIVKKKFSLFFVPRLLIICFNRFAKSIFSSYEKNGEFIDFPLENLDMGQYICGPDKKYSKYDLFGVSQHYGDTGGGHYTAICKNYDGNWYSYNDSSCFKSSPNNVVSESAYVLFYRKQNW